MVQFAKQQINYLNMHSSLDTLEDKQAKALKEIYQLCKTDNEGEGEQDEQLYKVLEEKKDEEEKGRSPRGYDSDNSDHIKEMFERMITKEDDNRNHLLPIENESISKTQAQLGLTPSMVAVD